MNVLIDRPGHYLAPVPTDLQHEIDRTTLVGGQLALVERYTEAFDVFRQLYERMLSQQPVGMRFHKGTPLHQMGWVRLLAGLADEGARWTALAFIEDSLSRAEELPGIYDELSRPAAQNLRLVGATESDLLELATSIRERVASTGNIPDPAPVYVELSLDERIRRWLAQRVFGRAPTIRVFVSSPSDVHALRLIVAETCRLLTLTVPASVESLLWEGGGRSNPEVPSFPAEITGAGPQAVIDHHVWSRLGGYDIYLGILWRRMGTPIGGWRSGTEAEFRYAMDRRQTSGRPADVLFYRKSTTRARPADPAVDAFTDELRVLGILRSVRGDNQFRRMVFDHLLAIVRTRIA